MTPAPPPPPPPVPPPPPPPPPTLKNVETNLLETGQTETRQISEEEFIKEIDDLIKSSRKWLEMGGGGGDSDEVILVVAMPLQTVILQSGPMCGIVALAEALEINRNIVGNDDGATGICSKDILETAISKGYTKQGEMFSVRQMLSLGIQFGASQDLSKILDVSNGEKSNKLCFEETARHLVTGHSVLFPYDADHNHSPSQRRGHAAHWAVVHGLACSVPYQRLSSILELLHLNPALSSTSPHFKILQTSNDLVILKPVTASSHSDILASNHATDRIEQISSLFTFEHTHVLSHQGKSFRTALWKYTDLLESNQNLKEIAPKINAQKEDFILNEGIENGLCSQILLLK